MDEFSLFNVSESLEILEYSEIYCSKAFISKDNLMLSILYLFKVSPKEW